MISVAERGKRKIFAICGEKSKHKAIAGMEINLRAFFNMDKEIAKKSFFYIFLLYALSSFIVWIFGLSLVFIIIIPVPSRKKAPAIVKNTIEITSAKVATIIAIFSQ